MVWIPWSIWACEAWLKRPGPLQALGFGVCMAMSIFAGYPHFFHGTVIYLVFRVLTIPIGEGRPVNWGSLLWRYVPSGSAAVLVCAGLSAVQWLPLLELVGESHSRDGIDEMLVPPMSLFVRGFLY